MTVTAWRIAKSKYSLAEAFSGTGAEIAGGCWNKIGTPVIYLAQNTSLAILELLVHLDHNAQLERYVLYKVTFPDNFISEIPLKKLPAYWNESPPHMEIQQLGTHWANELTSPVLKVPSAIVPTESNYILNPEHPKINKIKIAGPQPIEIDSRLHPPPSP